MNPENLDENDSSDEDYVPEGANHELPSEEDSDGEPESNVYDDDEEVTKKRLKTKIKANKKRKIEEVETVEEETKPACKEDNKQRVDSLWADFLKDTKTISKIKETEPVKKKEEKVTVTEVYKFANEEVIVTKEVEKDKIEVGCSSVGKVIPTKSNGTTGVQKKNGNKGLSSVLNQIGKKNKLSTLEKSKLDWNSFKKDEDIEEELTSYNKGKDGYLERQDFLQRADLRRFEIEKSMRATSRSHRNIM